MKKNNAAIEKSKKFAGRILRLSSYLRNFKAQTEAASLIVNSGLNIGSNLCKVFDNEYNDDVVETFGLSLKSAIETRFYLEAFKESGILTIKQFDSIYQDCIELIEIIQNILKSIQEGA